MMVFRKRKRPAQRKTDQAVSVRPTISLSRRNPTMETPFPGHFLAWAFAKRVAKLLMQRRPMREAKSPSEVRKSPIKRPQFSAWRDECRRQ